MEQVKFEDLNINRKENADFDNLEKLNFCGVYVIYDPNNNNEIIYVGSAYVQDIKTRLKQYTYRGDNNTLARAILRIDHNIEKVADDSKYDIAIKKIKTFKILAIEHQDLEYRIINETNPMYNKNGNSKAKK